MNKFYSLLITAVLVTCFSFTLAGNKPPDPSSQDDYSLWQKTPNGEIELVNPSETESEKSVISSHVSNLLERVQLYPLQNSWGKLILKHGTEEQIRRMYDLLSKGFATTEDFEKFNALTEEILAQIPRDPLSTITEIGDNCADPIAITSLPFSETRSMTDYNNYYFAGGNEVIYKLTLTETTRIKISLCNSEDPNFDAFLALVRWSDCSQFWFNGSSVQGHSLDDCGNMLPEIPYVEACAGDWAIIVDTWDPIYNTGSYTIDITIEDPVVLEPPPGAYMEQEACGDSTNNTDPINEAELISCGYTVCGAIWADYLENENDYTGDADFYTFTLEDTYEHWKVDLTGMSEFRTRVALYEIIPDLPFPMWWNIESFYPGQPFANEITVRPGTYLLAIYPARLAADIVCDDNSLYYFQLDCGPIEPGGPVNDWCDDVTPRLLESGDSLIFTGNTTNATIDCIQNALVPDFDIIPTQTFSGEVWTAFTTTDTLDVIVAFCDSDPNSVGQCASLLYNDCPCGYDGVSADSYNYLYCSDGSLALYFNALPPGTYYYEIFRDLDILDVTDYRLAISGTLCPQPQPNDNCANAIAVYEDIQTEFNTTYASFDGPGYCLESKNVWFIYEPDETHAVSVSLEGSRFNTKMAIYEGGECPPSQESMIECNNNYNSLSNFSYIEFLAVEGTRYLIEVGGTNLEARGAGFMLISPIASHDVRVDKIISPLPGNILDPGTDYELNAIVSNRGFYEETFNVIAVDNYGFELIEEYITLAPGEQTNLFEGNFYTSPSETCEDHEFKVITSLNSDEFTSNDTFTVTYNIPREGDIRHYGYYTDGEDAWISGPVFSEMISATKFVADGRDAIVYIGGKFANTTSIDSTIDPVKLYLFQDDNDDGFPDDEPRFEAVVQLQGMEYNWVYAVLPCDVVVDSGQVFWVGFGIVRDGREGFEGIFVDAHPECDSSWLRSQYGYWERNVEANGDKLIGAWALPDSLTGIDDCETGLPLFYGLAQNYPNPFNARTVIRYNLAEPGLATITIFDILGRKVETLVDDYQTAGLHQVTWNAGDFASGLYYYRIQVGDYTETKNMLLMK